uniref:F-box protein 41 n=1 Tax=Amphiprion percula TaxID=161767 RepID=A0A3P8TKM5_AMPPE
MSSYFCPRCGDQHLFSSIPELRSHLVSRHTYETLLLLSQVPSTSAYTSTSTAQRMMFYCLLTHNEPGALLPLPGPTASQNQSSSLGTEPLGFPLPLACLDLAPSSASVRLLREMFGSWDRRPPKDPSTALALPGPRDSFPGEQLGEAGVSLGLPVGIGLEERLGLGLDRRIARTFAEVEERVNRRVGRLRAELQRREAELQQERRDGERLRGEKLEVEEKAAYLSRQVVTLNDSTVFIETLLDRADRAERQLLLLGSHQNHFRDRYVDPYHLAQVYPPTAGRGGRSLDSSTDDIITTKTQGTMGNRVKNCNLYSVRQSYFFLLPDAPSSLHSTPSNRRGDRQLGADTLRLRAGLLCVFPYLDVRSLLRAAEVCSDWRFVARHPAVWTRLRLENAKVSTEFLTTLSQWCTQTQSMILNNLKPRSRRVDETRDDYHRNTRGSMESGVEALLRSAGGSLLHLSISQCPHILTDRMLWLASCYCRNLTTLTYRSSSDPLSQEVLWALGAGCRSISSLQVAPAHPCQQPTRFGNRCLQTIGRCWPHLRSLSVGGAGCGTQGLVTVVRSCPHLQLLELEHITDLGLQAATELSRAGLKELQTLILTHTPVSGQALLHLHSVCDNIRSIVVEVSPSDYFEDPDSQEAQHLFGEIISTLQVLQKRPGLSDVLQVIAEGFF